MALKAMCKYSTLLTDQLSEAYWASLGENGPFLQSLLESQQQQNQHLLTHFNNFQNNLANAASTAAVAAAQHIVIPTSPNISSVRINTNLAL